MKISIGLAAAVVVAAFLSVAALHWYFRGKTLIYESVPGTGHAFMAALLDRSAEQIVQEEGLDHDAFCLRVPVWRRHNDDGCVLVRRALVARWRQCTPYRSNNGNCYAIEMSEALLQNRRIRDLLFTRAADICFYANRTVRGAYSIDCTSPGDEFEMTHRAEPLLCVFALDESEEPSGPAIAIRRGRQVQDYWCREWEKLVRVRSRAQPTDCWLGVRRPVPGGGSRSGCRRD